MPIQKIRVRIATIIIFFTIFLILFDIEIVSGVKLGLAENNKFYYAVICTDYCGSKTWDATYLDADLYFQINNIDNKTQLITIVTYYNSSTYIDRNYTSDYGEFIVMESFNFITRQNNANKGLYAWQFITNDEIEEKRPINVTIPYFFLSHAPDAFIYNNYQMTSEKNLEEIKTTGKSFSTIKYTGKWTHSYLINERNITIHSELVLNYDTLSGVLIKLQVEMEAFYDSIEGEEVITEAVGSFKILLVLPERTTHAINLPKPATKRDWLGKVVRWQCEQRAD